MTMPETAMHEDGGVMARQDHVRRAREVTTVEAIAKPGGMQRTAYEAFGPRVF